MGDHIAKVVRKRFPETVGIAFCADFKTDTLNLVSDLINPITGTDMCLYIEIQTLFQTHFFLGILRLMQIK